MVSLTAERKKMNESLHLFQTEESKNSTSIDTSRLTTMIILSIKVLILS